MSVNTYFNGFWSLTLYNEHHFYNVNPLNRLVGVALQVGCLRSERRQGKQLATSPGGAVLALHPRLLAQAGATRSKLDTPPTVTKTAR